VICLGLEARSQTTFSKGVTGYEDTFFMLFVWNYFSKGKVKVLPITGHEGPEGE
jgi:hypothetical protein